MNVLRDTLRSAELNVSRKTYVCVSKLKSIKNIVSFVLSGFIAIIVGCFMLRGTMNLWDNQDKKNQTKDNKE